MTAVAASAGFVVFSVDPSSLSFVSASAFTVAANHEQDLKDSLSLTAAQSNRHSSLPFVSAASAEVMLAAAAFAVLPANPSCLPFVSASTFALAANQTRECVMSHRRHWIVSRISCHTHVIESSHQRITHKTVTTHRGPL